MPEPGHFVVVGASLAGLRACEGLRTGGFNGRITLVGAEQHVPYDRPPLSKKVLQGEWELDRIALRSAEALKELELELRLGVPAAALELSPAGRGGTVTLADGMSIVGEAVIIATGSRPRTLRHQPSGAHVLRTIEDSMALRGEFAAGDRRVCLIGAGFIGLEAAAAARMAGNEVTVLEALPAPMLRAFGPAVGAAMAAVHEDEGVDIRCGVTVEAFTDSGVLLNGGELVAADVILVGIGAEPVVDWLAGSGLTLGDGVVVDEMLRAAPGVFAAGDVARWPNGQFGGEQMRIEHWTNAAEQGAHAAGNVLAGFNGVPLTPYRSVPFVWSDQYRHRIQYVGHSSAHDDVVIAVGTPQARKFVALYQRDGRLRAAAGLNLPRLVMRHRKLIAEGAAFADALVLAGEQADSLRP
ncbi:MAG: FAD-dependent oxidoreductase [Acidimicrobiia bacterium]|nr:FAD-dependent oxidoreductase [Acidimicrobiia bacterium]